MKLIIATVLIVLLSACGNTTSTHNELPEKSDPKLEDTDTLSVAKANTSDKLTIKEFPIVDSTNFDNYPASGSVNLSLVKKLELEKWYPEGENFRINYKIPFSKKFSSIVVSYQKGEHELFTTLINFDQQYKIIDKLDIAYDEIAESAFQKISIIHKDRIVVESWNYMNETPTKETNIYTLTDNGKFVKKEDKKSIAN